MFPISQKRKISLSDYYTGKFSKTCELLNVEEKKHQKGCFKNWPMNIFQINNIRRKNSKQLFRIGITQQDPSSAGMNFGALITTYFHLMKGYNFDPK